jgi:ankyrin repeat protein
MTEARFFIPVYDQDDKFYKEFNTLGRKYAVTQARYQCENTSASYSDHGDEIQRLSGGSHTFTAVVETFLGLLYELSNNCLTTGGFDILCSIIDAPAWDTILPHLRNVFSAIDSNTVQAIAEGLLRESVSWRHQRMLELSLALGADPTQQISYHDYYGRQVRSTPLVGICGYRGILSEDEVEIAETEKLILSLLKREPCTTNSCLFCIIKSGCLAIAEDVIRSQPEWEMNFAIPASDLEDGSLLFDDEPDPATPLALTCSLVKSAQKLSLVRCLLDRNAKADLAAMVAAASMSDEEVISLLYQHGAPINGFIPGLGTPVSSVCQLLRSDRGRDLKALTLLLSLGASPDGSEHMGLQFSPLHIFAGSSDWEYRRREFTEIIDLLLAYGADINRRVRERSPLDHAISTSNLDPAIRLLSAGCEVTGEELNFICTSPTYRHLAPSQSDLRQLVGILLEKAPSDAAALHRRNHNGLTVLQRAIQNEDEDMILTLFEFGVTPAPLDFLHMLPENRGFNERVCRLSSRTQMRLVLAATSSRALFTDVLTLRRVLAFACPEVVRHVLGSCPVVYDSKALCYLIARITSADDLVYSTSTFRRGRADENVRLRIEDLHEFFSRRTLSNSDPDWESTAVAMAARAGHVSMLRTIIESCPEVPRRNAMIPIFLLKYALRPVRVGLGSYSTLGLWVKYCRMDHPETRCSPLAAAAMVTPESSAEEVFDLLLALDYQPDEWTVLIASCRGYVSILRRLKQLKSWPHILSHQDRPDWCPTSLQMAVFNDHFDTVQLLLGTEAKVGPLDFCPWKPFSTTLFPQDGTVTFITLPRTALQHAVDMKNMKLVTLLVDAGAEINAPAAMDSGATALQIASIQGSVPMVQYLIDRGADPYAAGAAKHGRTALQGAAEHGRKDVVELLLAHGAPTTWEHRKQIVEAIPYAEMNCHHIVASILREHISPQWSDGDDERFDVIEDDWETSSENSTYQHFVDEISDWDRHNRDWAAASGAYESCTDSHAEIDVLWIQNPAAQQEQYFFPDAMELDIGNPWGLNSASSSNPDSNSVISAWDFQEDVHDSDFA